MQEKVILLLLIYLFLAAHFYHIIMSDNNPENATSRELEDLRNQNRILSREMETVKEASHNIFSALIACQGLLLEFTRPEVRRAFLDGRLGLEDHSDGMLSCLDAFRRIMLPSPAVSKGKVREDNSTEAFITSLLSGDARVPSHKGAGILSRVTFGEWRDIFHTLMVSPYWLEGGEGENVNTDGWFAAVGKTTIKGSLSSGKLSGASGYKEYPKRKENRRKSSKRWKRRSSPSSSDSDVASTDSSTDSADDFPMRGRRSRRSTKTKEDDMMEMFRALAVRKEVVPPSTFDLEQGVSFKKFLRSYERYFDAKYSGDDRDRSRCLVKFLGPKMKHLFEAVGGHQGKYSNVKRQLIDMVSSQGVSNKEAKYMEFCSAKMQPLETLSMFCVRLEHLAKVVFSDMDERERQLCRKLRECAPTSFESSLQGARGTLSMLDQKMSWQFMKKLAKSTDQTTREMVSDFGGKAVDCYAAEPSTWRSRGGPQKGNRGFSPQRPAPVQDGASGGRFQFQRREFRPNRGNFSSPTGNKSSKIQKSPEPRSQKRFPVPPTCDWCGRRGHREETCWLKQGPCNSCGALGHKMEACPKSNQTGVTPVCSLCSGRHYGMTCPNRQSTN